MIGFVQVLAVVTGLIFGGVLLARSPVRVALVVLAITIGLDSVTWPDSFGVGLGVNVYLDDVAILVFLAAGVIVALRRKAAPEVPTWPLFVLLALLAINFIRGASEFGIKPAGNGVRDLASLIVPSIGFLLLKPSLTLPPERIARWFVWFGCGFVLFAAARWIGVLSTPQDLIESTSDFRQVVRVLPAPEAMIVAQALIAILFIQLRNGVRWWGALLGGVLVVTTIALQHRSVWTSLLVGLGWLAIRTFRRAAVPWLQIAAMVFVGATIAGVILVHTGRVDSVASLVAKNVDEPSQEDSTWNWRVQGFSNATDRTLSGGLIDALLGPPSGKDLGPGASVASIFIHNLYVSTLAYYGLIGVTSLLAWLFITAKRVGGWVGSTRETREWWIGRVFLQALLFSQLTYFMAYSGDLLQGAVLAVVMVLLGTDSGPVPDSTSLGVRQRARPRSRATAVP
jgi:hypothetical protein